MGRRVLAFHWGDVCTPWRIGIPLTALAESGYTTTLVPMDSLRTIPDGTDLLVFQSPASETALNLMAQARQLGVSTVVDMDDLFGRSFLRTSWLAGEASAATAGVRDQFHAEVLHYFHACLRTADAVTVSTRELALAYARFNSNIHVLPNCYNDANPFWRVSPPARATVHLGFAGTGDHRHNVAILKEALAAILCRHPEVRLLEAGKPEVGPNLVDQIDAPPEQLVHLGEVSFDLYPLLLQQMDIVLAPLVDSPFSRCKSNIRCITAGVVGVPVIASPVGTYADYIYHGVNGFHANSADEWQAYIEALLEDPQRRRTMGEANRAAAAAYAISTNQSRWVEVYESVLSRRRRA